MHYSIPTNFKEVLETDFACFFLNKRSDTLLVKYRESTKITREVAQEALSVIKPFKDAGSVYAVIDFSAKFLSITPKAKRYFKENVSPHNTRLVGVVVNETTTRIIANFYARFDKPKVPTRVFNSVKDALKWIEEARN